METLVFEKIPKLVDILPGGGRPGFNYALVGPGRINELKSDASDNWDLIAGLPPIEVGGKPAFLMGCGEAINGARSTATIPVYWVDEEFVNAQSEDSEQVQEAGSIPVEQGKPALPHTEGEAEEGAEERKGQGQGALSGPLSAS